MEVSTRKLGRIWTVAEAKARSSEVFRLAEELAQSTARKSFVVVPERLWREQALARKPRGQWLADHMPRGRELAIPAKRSSRRGIPFIGEDMP